jgi:hypothetical protein
MARNFPIICDHLRSPAGAVPAESLGCTATTSGWQPPARTRFTALRSNTSVTRLRFGIDDPDAVTFFFGHTSPQKFAPTKACAKRERARPTVPTLPLGEEVPGHRVRAAASTALKTALTSRCLAENKGAAAPFLRALEVLFSSPKVVASDLTTLVTGCPTI